MLSRRLFLCSTAAVASGLAAHRALAEVTPARIRDIARIDYLRGHLAMTARAISDGVPIRAYHCWSLPL